MSTNIDTVNKVIKIIKSCKTINHIIISSKYINLLILKLKKEKYNYNIVNELQNFLHGQLWSRYCEIINIEETKSRENEKKRI